MSPRSDKTPMNFKTMPQLDVPQGRNGKHKTIVTKILSDLSQVDAGIALKVPLAGLDGGKEKVRAALNRATRKAGHKVATATDANFLYIWNEDCVSTHCRCGLKIAIVLTFNFLPVRRSRRLKASKIVAHAGFPCTRGGV